MRTLLLILFFCLGLLNCEAQVNALTAYRSKDYRTAIKLYRADLAKRETSYERFMLATCYQKVDSIPQAIREYETVANKKERNFENNNFAVQACEILGILFESKKQYQKALHYHQLLKEIFEQARFNDVNLVRFHFFNANNQARCFAALGQTDSAIRVLTPFMFYPYTALNDMMFVVEGAPGNKPDSLKHDTVSRFYFSLLQKRYTKAQIKAEFQKADQSFTYTEDRQPVDTRGYVWEHIKCTIHIYGVDIVTLERRFGNKETQLPKEVQTSYYTKAYQLARFRELPICRMVRAL